LKQEVHQRRRIQQHFIFVARGSYNISFLKQEVHQRRRIQQHFIFVARGSYNISFLKQEVHQRRNAYNIVLAYSTNGSVVKFVTFVH
jgi:hypothetical protein